MRSQCTHARSVRVIKFPLFTFTFHFIYFSCFYQEIFYVFDKTVEEKKVVPFAHSPLLANDLPTQCWQFTQSPSENSPNAAPDRDDGK